MLPFQRLAPLAASWPSFCRPQAPQLRVERETRLELATLALARLRLNSVFGEVETGLETTTYPHFPRGSTLIPRRSNPAVPRSYRRPIGESVERLEARPPLRRSRPQVVGGCSWPARPPCTPSSRGEPSSARPEWFESPVRSACRLTPSASRISSKTSSGPSTWST